MYLHWKKVGGYLILNNGYQTRQTPLTSGLQTERSGRIAFSNPDFTRYWFARVLSVFGTECNTTVLWQILITKDPFVGCRPAQFAPFLPYF